jgi:guanylate kinase
MSEPGSRRGIPFVVAAPSGTGKSTVCRRVVDRNQGIILSVSHTTRPIRAAEVDGVDYYFVTPSGFQRLVDDGVFIESALYNGNHYGTSWESVAPPLAAGCDVLLEIEVQGARQVRKRRDDVRMIFLLPPSFEALRLRLAGRGTDSEEQVRKRLDLAREEFAAIGDFDYAIENDDLERCATAVESVIRAERAGDTAEVRERFAVGPARARFEKAD